MLVTHDFAQAALLADEIAVIDRGRIVQRGTAGELSARPASAFVADFTGAAVLLGVARAAPRPGRRRSRSTAAARSPSTDAPTGAVGVAVYPWEITLEPAGTAAHGSALNRLDAEVVSVTEVGNRARVGLLAAQPLVAEVTAESVARLGLAPGAGRRDLEGDRDPAGRALSAARGAGGACRGGASTARRPGSRCLPARATRPCHELRDSSRPPPRWMR